MRLNKTYLVAGLLAALSLTTPVRGDDRAATAQCVGDYYMASTMALSCDLGFVIEPACVNDHLASYDADADAFFATEDAINAYQVETAAGFGLAWPAGSDGLCAAAQSQRTADTGIGRLLRAAE